MHSDEVEPETWAVMGGRAAPSAGTPLNVPPVLASNFELGSERAYSRDDATPTWEAFEELLGGLEGGLAVAFASGMGAVAAIFDLLPVSVTVVLGDDCYQAVAGLAAAGAAQGRWRLVRVAVEDTAGWVEAAAHADLLWLESPSNPLLAVADLAAVCAAQRKPDALVAVDSTLATLAASVSGVARALYSVPATAKRMVGVLSTFLYHWLSEPVTGSRYRLSPSVTNHTGRELWRQGVRPVIVSSISLVSRSEFLKSANAIWSSSSGRG